MRLVPGQWMVTLRSSNGTWLSSDPNTGQAILSTYPSQWVLSINDAWNGTLYSPYNRYLGVTGTNATANFDTPQAWETQYTPTSNAIGFLSANGFYLSGRNDNSVTADETTMSVWTTWIVYVIDFYE